MEITEKVECLKKAIGELLLASDLEFKRGIYQLSPEDMRASVFMESQCFSKNIKRKSEIAFIVRALESVCNEMKHQIKASMVALLTQELLSIIGDDSSIPFMVNDNDSHPRDKEEGEEIDKDSK